MPMPIGKAIEILSNSANRGMTTFDQDFKDALNMGTEAMKLIYNLRNVQSFGIEQLLPGETEE